MDEFKRIPFGGNPYADFEFFKLELRVSEIRYTPERIYAHFEFVNGCKVDIQGVFYPSLIRKAVAQVRELQDVNIGKTSCSGITTDS